MTTTMIPGSPRCSAIRAPLIENRASPRASVRDQQSGPGRLPETDVDQRQGRRREDDHELHRIGDPEDRVAVEQDVPDRPPADGRHRGDDPDPDQVEPLPPGGERATGREDGDAEEAEQVEGHQVLPERICQEPGARCRTAGFLLEAFRGNKDPKDCKDDKDTGTGGDP
jgi:hypothetical protein